MGDSHDTTKSMGEYATWIIRRDTEELLGAGAKLQSGTKASGPGAEAVISAIAPTPSGRPVNSSLEKVYERDITMVRIRTRVKWPSPRATVYDTFSQAPTTAA